GFFRRRVARGLFGRPFGHRRCNAEITCVQPLRRFSNALFLWKKSLPESLRCHKSRSRMSPSPFYEASCAFGEAILKQADELKLASLTISPARLHSWLFRRSSDWRSLFAARQPATVRPQS